MDITPPTIDNCIDPPEFYVPIFSNTSDNRSFVDWDSPVIYDNSETNVSINQSIHAGYLDIGVHAVNYIAADSSGNENRCTINVTVKQLKCNTLISPANGQSLCAQNLTHTWCDISCDFGYTIYEDDIDQIRLLCENNNPQWKYDILPDCTKIEVPDSIEQIFSITLDDFDFCRNNSNLSAALLDNLLVTQLRQQLCDDSTSENCQVLSEIPECNDIIKNQSNSDNNNAFIDGNPSNRDYYSIVKRDINQIPPSIPKTNINMKIKVYTKISKRLGLWNSNLSRAENLKVIKEELKTYHTNEYLRDRLHAMRINVQHLNLVENLLCKNGSVLKKNICGN